MTRSQLIEKIAAQNEMGKKDVKGVLETLATIGYRELKKTGIFLVPGFAKFVVIKKPATEARQGTNPFNGEPMMFKTKPARKIVRAGPVKAAKSVSSMGPAELGRFWKPREDRQDGTAIVGVVSCSTAPNCTDCGDVTCVPPPTLCREWIVKAARQVGLGALGPPRVAFGRALPGTTSARVRWSTLGYVEKVRLLSLRHCHLRCLSHLQPKPQKTQ
jgi:nucleoid DNA-binding protein